jgi:hypothetical protein
MPPALAVSCIVAGGTTTAPSATALDAKKPDESDAAKAKVARAQLVFKRSIGHLPYVNNSLHDNMGQHLREVKSHRIKTALLVWRTWPWQTGAMGLEAETTCLHSGKPHKVKALLESTELILRGALQRKLPLAALRHIAAQGEALTFEAEGEHFALTLGKAKAATWAKKIATPPPSLAQKLGLSETAKAFVFGTVDDADLTAALKGRTTAKPAEAAILLAVLTSEAELAALLEAHGKNALPLWLVNIKGPKSPLGENAIRAALRAAGFKDVKTCAVSAALSATRYVKAK